MRYKSTRDMYSKEVDFSNAVLRGLALDKGLYEPVEIPHLDIKNPSFLDMDYIELSYDILSKFISDFEKEDIKKAVESSYGQGFGEKILDVVNIKEGIYSLELFHGKTSAFKDMALSLLPHLIVNAKKKRQVTSETLILTATSGDTGKAALEAFKDVDGIKIIVFYPVDGVSEIQKRQMVTQEGNNTYVIGIEGNFDDAQRGVKEIFADDEIKGLFEKKNIELSSANSINIGRFLPQIIYYVYSYLELVRRKDISIGEKVNYIVPTGNFGNILACYYAKLMGLPVGEIVCASNENKVLVDFLNSGKYDTRREFKKTNSPSMDILVSSNVERFLSNIFKDPVRVKSLMEKLADEGWYEIDSKLVKNEMGSYFTNEEEVRKSIREAYENYGYLMDTHTAVAYDAYKKSGFSSGEKSVVVSTASPFKFVKDVLKSIGEYEDGMDEFECLDKLSKVSGLQIPNGIAGLESKEIRHQSVCRPGDMKEMIKTIMSV